MSVFFALGGGCVFDQSGVPDTIAGAVDAAVGAGDGTTGPSVSDAQPVTFADAALCRDDDGDQFQIVGVPGSSCGENLDCDDRDPLAYPGQPDFFTVPRTGGGFDFNCDGNEERSDTEVGSDCGWDWWDCVGTGWVGSAPACGQEGTWHRCEDSGGCRETERVMRTMSCR